jgi:Zn ribbon nucleic-acid-binding protein
MWDWINCVVLFRHEYGIWCEEGSVFLRCIRCGHRSPGWDVEHQAEKATAPAVHNHRRFPVLVRRQGATGRP